MQHISRCGFKINIYDLPCLSDASEMTQLVPVTAALWPLSLASHWSTTIWMLGTVGYFGRTCSWVTSM